MQARGFRGEIRLLDDPILAPKDWVGLAPSPARPARQYGLADERCRRTAFDVRDVSYRYNQAPALNGLSMQVATGERVALLGANGSGKSTLLRLLAGLWFPDGGDISFLGERLTERAFAG